MLSNTDMIYATYEPFNHSACLCNVIATQCYWSQCYWDISGAVLWSVFLTPPVTPLCIVCSDRTYVSRGNLSWKSGPSNAFEIFSKSFSSEAYCGKCIPVSKWKLHLSHRAASLSSFPHETLKIYVWENLTKFPENGNKGCSLRPCCSAEIFSPVLNFQENIGTSRFFALLWNRHPKVLLRAERERKYIEVAHHLRYIIEYW